LCHLWLGTVDGLVPIGAWAAITGHIPWEAWALGAAVALWVAGFDLFYSLLDAEIDRAQGLQSIATRFGERGAFLVARAFHLVTGPNGAGKTTLLRLCAGLAIPSAGTLEVEPDRSLIGFLGHDPLVYRELTVLENLDLYGRLYRVPERRERIGMLLERFGLWEARAERTGSYSRGMLQRLALCRALLHDPELLILDEPANALDEAGEELLDRELDEL